MNGYTGYQGVPASGDAREQLAARLRSQILGQPLPQTVGGGMGMLGAGLAAGFAKRNGAFPAVPGGANPSLATGLANFFTGNRNGGLR